MKKFSRILSVLVLTVCSLPIFAQQVTDLRINEVFIKNDSNYVDEYGRNVPWVEIFNTAYNSVNLAECYLTDDTTGLADGTGVTRWYHITKGDPKTLIEQRSSVVFFMDASPLYGTFHVNFDISKSPTNYIALISSNGKTIIDIMEYPIELRDTAISYGCKDDGIATVKTKGDNLAYLDYFTPGSTNNVLIGRTKQEVLKEDDPYGIGLAIISMSVVFSALILIFVMLKIFGKVSSRQGKKTAPAVAQVAPVMAEVKETKTEDLQAEHIAAIAMALHLHMNSMHDEESEILTFADSPAQYSPWAQRELTMKRVQRKF
ncbi:MAG: OadG family protein [Bacteroidales bacterium]|nr:OadG family protein [Bacteroidales bacterium]